MTWEFKDKLGEHPALHPFRRQLAVLSAAPSFPGPEHLQSMLPQGSCNSAGKPITFRSSDTMPELNGEGAYEREIASTGHVSTRPGDLHDVCNAMVWARFPKLKAALNQRHLIALPDSRPGRRGHVRDALTLFDECGLIVACEDQAPLSAIANHDWPSLFGPAGDAWPPALSLFMVGHANLEKLMTPYPGMIAQCLLLHVPGGLPNAGVFDEALARLWLHSTGPARPRDLCPLPIMGIPGWWIGDQDEAFYANRDVFRPPRDGRTVPPIWRLIS